MAHQNHNLPWNALASNFKYAFESRSFGHRTNLVPLMGPQQGKQIDHFAKVFARNLEEFSLSERAKCPPAFEPFQSSHDTVIGTVAAQVIEKSVEYVRGRSHRPYCGHCCPVHYHPHEISPCSCEDFPDPYILGHWLSVFSCPSCCLRLGYADVVDLTKILLLHNQMESVLRIASHPDVHLEKFFSFPWELSVDYGWASVSRSALYAYIALNVIYLRPETWPSSQLQTDSNNSGKPADYRRTAAYQHAVYMCTAVRGFDVLTLPHRRFFGIPHGALRLPAAEETLLLLLGRFPLPAQLEEGFRNKHVPGRSDVAAVADILHSKGLPIEIVLPILDLASYTAQSRLEVSDDPLHPANEEELKKYLSYCWQLLLRCDILADACGCKIDWKEEVKDCIWRLFFKYPGYPKASKLSPSFQDWASD